MGFQVEEMHRARYVGRGFHFFPGPTTLQHLHVFTNPEAPSALDYRDF